MKPFSVLVLSMAFIAYAEKKQGETLRDALVSLTSGSGTTAFMIKDLERDSVLAAVGADSMLNPASVSKCVTAAAAFELLGPGFTFTTRVFADSIQGKDSGLTVKNLYIEGCGDPGFSAERLWLFVEHLYHRGIRNIKGDLVLDDFLFDSITVGPGFDEDTTSRAYQPLISALAMNYNTVAVHCRPGPVLKAPVAIDLFPEIAGLKVLRGASTVPAGKPNQIDVRTSADSGTTVVTVAGVMAIDDPGGYTYRKLWQTWEAFGGALRPLFARRGISFTGRIVRAKVPRRLAQQPPLYEFSSEPLSVPVNNMFKFSSNFAAEMLFKALSARRDSVPGSWDRSAKAVAAWWKERGLPGTPVIKNGSGMGNTNRISPAQTVALLSYVWKQKAWCPEYITALSAGGIDGTLKSRFMKPGLKGLVRGKTGTLNAYGISTLAGYLLLQGRAPCAFAIFCTKTGRSQFDDWAIQEKIVEKVIDERKRQGAPQAPLR